MHLWDLSNSDCHFNSCIVFYSLEYCLLPNPLHLLSFLTWLITQPSHRSCHSSLPLSSYLALLSTQWLNSTLSFLPKYVLHMPLLLMSSALPSFTCSPSFRLDYCRWMDSCYFWVCLPLGFGPVSPPAIQLPDLQIWLCNSSTCCMVADGSHDVWCLQ